MHKDLALESADPLRTEISLIGPIGAGKTTVGRVLAQHLDIPLVSLDSLSRDYFREIGFVEQEQNGPDGMIASRFKVHGVQRVLQSHRDCIFDFGAGHTVYRETEAFEEVQAAFRLFLNVFLLLPCSDLMRSAEILEQRNARNAWLRQFQEASGYDPNAHFLTHPSNFKLAKHIVYSEGQSPEETAESILRLAVRSA